CAHPLVELLVAALTGEVQVELAERRLERVWVAHRERVAIGISDLQLVAQRHLCALDDALEEPVAGRLELDRRPLLRPRDDAVGGRPVGAYDDVPVLLMRTQYVGIDGGHAASSESSSSRRQIPATGIDAQSGRLSSS